MLEFNKWNVKQAADYHALCSKYGISEICAKVAAARLVSISEAELFGNSDSISSPFELKDMDRAVERINEAIDLGQKITVYGDYDADGVTATVILYSYLEAMGADVDFYIPERMDEGYGLNVDAVKKLCDNGCELIVTVDNGISAVDEIEYAKSLGMDVVVTDHHKPQSVLPDCIVVDPHRADCTSKFKDICGAFVAFKLVAALDDGDYEGAFEQFAELVTIATLADVVPLVSENRTVVRLGLERIKNTDNLGLCALMNAAFSENYEVDATSVAFGIVPRINAAGRMNSAKHAVNLLISEDEQSAKELSSQLCAFNDKRKNAEQEILTEIEEIFKNQPEILSHRVVVVCSKGWHHGVLGIVASKIVEKTGKPAIILSEENGIATGSGRSVEGFSLFDAVSYCNELFTKFGGHSLAVGVTIDADKVNAFREKINLYAEQNYKFMPQRTLTADAVISPNEITLAAVKQLALLEPTGKDNPAPVFVLQDAYVGKIASIGNGKHSRLSLRSDNSFLNAVYFGKTANELAFYCDRKVDVLISLKINNYMDSESVSVQILDIRPSGINDELFFKEKELSLLAARLENLTQKQAAYLMPQHSEAAEVYKTVKALKPGECFADAIWYMLGGKINRAKLGVILEAFCQVGLSENLNGQYFLLKTESKKDLFSSNILKHISGYLSY